VLTPLALQEDIAEALPQGLTAWDWATAGAIFLAGVILAKLAHRLISRWIEKGHAQRSGRVVGRVVAYVIALGGFIYALVSLRVQIAPLLGAIGLGGLALAIAMQSTLENFISGVFLEARRPFRRGDQIATNEFEGTVEDVNLRATLIKTFDGERVVIPNGTVLNNPIVNFTALGALRTTLTVGVAFDSDLPQVKRVVQEAVRGVEGVLEAPPPMVFVDSYADSSIQLAVHFWHAPQRMVRWQVRDRVAIAVKQAFDRENITIPFPQIRLGPDPG